MRLRESPSLLPTADERCAWDACDIERPANAETLSNDIVADCVVVGAGYTGLACARKLAALQPNWQIVLIDALRVGQGSAGRNSGYLMDVGHWQDALGPAGNRGLTRLSRHGIANLREQVQRHDIDCEWFSGGRYHVAVNERGRVALEHFRAGLDAMDERYTRVDADELAEKIGTTHYRYGLHLAGGAFVQPARLVLGLARALPEGVRLFESSPVVRIESGSRHVVHTEGGTITCSQLVLATNGYTGSWGIDAGRILPMLTFASITQPCPNPPGSLPQWGVVPEERMGSTVRRTADGRLLFRSGVRYTARPGLGESDLERMQAAHRRSLAVRFPELADLPFSHTWAGVLGVTINNGTRFGRVAQNVWCCAAHNGVGIALGTALGDLLAYEVTGQPHPLLEHVAAIPRPGWLPPRPLLDVGIRPYTFVLQQLAGAER